MSVYVVTAYRWGDRERHSYVVGVYSTEGAARRAAEAEEGQRGGKYECEILRMALDRTEQAVVKDLTGREM